MTCVKKSSLAHQFAASSLSHSLQRLDIVLRQELIQHRHKHPNQPAQAWAGHVHTHDLLFLLDLDGGADHGCENCHGALSTRQLLFQLLVDPSGQFGHADLIV